MLILTPKDALFNYEQAKKLWEKCKDKLEDSGKDFDSLVSNNHLFSFFIEKSFVGCICFYQKDEKIFVNAFSGRKTHKENIECLKKALTFYNCDIYAECKEKPAIYCLLKVGFKKIKDNIYKYERS